MKVGQLGKRERKHVPIKPFDSRCVPVVSDLQVIDGLFNKLSCGSERILSANCTTDIS